MTESFDDALVTVHKYRLLSGKMCNRLQRAHDHDIEQLRRSRFREGYEAGQRSLDAEHYAVALRLKHLPLDEDSHGNLSQIARAIWHSDFGWTRGACAALRDELVRLLGGVHDEPAQAAATCGACDADCDCHNQQSQAVAYDVLGSERHKAVCALRKVPDDIGKSELTYQETEHMIYAALGVEKELLGYYKGLDALRDRLIHLLGGDDGTCPNANRTSPNAVQGASITDEPVSQESPNLANYDTENGGESSITADLRELIASNTSKDDGVLILTEFDQRKILGKLTTIADLIDEQEHKLKKQRNGFRHGMIAAQDLLEKRTEERDELQKKLDGARGVIRHLTNQWGISNKKRRELQKKLDTIREALDG